MIEQYIDVFNLSGGGGDLSTLAAEYGGLPAMFPAFGNSFRSFTTGVAVHNTNEEIYVMDRSSRVYVFNKDTTLNRTITTVAQSNAIAIRVSEERGLYTLIDTGSSGQIRTADVSTDTLVHNVSISGSTPRIGQFDFSHGTVSTIWTGALLTPNNQTITEIDYTNGNTITQFTIANIPSPLQISCVRRRPGTDEIWVASTGGRLSYFDEASARSGTASVTNIFTTYFGTSPGNRVERISDMCFSSSGRIFLNCYARIDGASGDYYRTIVEIDDTGTIINEWNGPQRFFDIYVGIDSCEFYTNETLVMTGPASNLYRAHLMVVP